jgi:hypothetical protein
LIVSETSGRLLIAAALAFFALALVSESARANESLGELAVSGIFLEPSFTYAENHSGSFNAGNSFLAATWSRDSLLSATFKVGDRALLGQPARFGDVDGSQIAIIEAYAQADSDLGRVRAGLIPVPFGLEGGDAEERLRFPRSLLFQRRMVVIRDMGASYHISNEGWFSDIAGHNGEGGPDLDNEIWLTVRGGWQGGRFLRAGFSGTAGRTNPASTNPDPSATPPTVDEEVNKTGIDITKAAKIRLANVFLDWEFAPMRIEVEADIGDALQDGPTSGTTIDRKIRAGHLDIEYIPQPSWSALARYDTLNPDTDGSGSRVDQYIAGLSWRSKYETSVLYLFFEKTQQQGSSEDIHSVQLLWRLTPSANSFRSSL